MKQKILSTGVSNRYSYYALTILTLLNLLNYLDRYIFASLLPYIKADSGYTDEQMGAVGSAFTLIYTVCSPLFGYLGDRYRRGRLIALGITIWNVATAAAELTTNFQQLLASRGLVGVGEANYATIGPGLLSDFFTKARRGMVMSIFFASLPIGTSLGYTLGGYLGAPERFGWRHTFYLVGLPGLLTALAAYFIFEPQRGAMDDPEDKEAARQSIGWIEGYKILFTNRGFLLANGGYAAVTFALGALVFWAPEWLKNDKGMTVEDAGLVLG